MREQFLKKRFNAEAQDIIEKANILIEAYQADDMKLTLRQLYYQFVARGWIENKPCRYERMSVVINNARLGGRIDWAAIEDRNRQLDYYLIEESQKGALKGIEYGLALDMWNPQNTHIEFWVEKDALSSVVDRACRKYKVPYLACKGYLSASAAYEAGKRYETALREGKRCIMVHLGDHDPSGLDMTRDNAKRLRMFARSNEVEVIRLALNRDQIRKYNPPPNFAKTTDRRFARYREEHGEQSWELDALEPKVLNDMIIEQIKEFVDQEVWDKTMRKQQRLREDLAKLEQGWEKVAAYINKKHPEVQLLEDSLSHLYDYSGSFSDEDGDQEPAELDDLISAIEAYRHER